MKNKLFALLVILGLMLTACGGGAASRGGGGGTVVLIIPEEPAGLNRYLADAAIVTQVSDATIIGLTTANEKGEYVARLAADLPTLSDQNKTVTWKLREGLKWSDGEPLTSDDIKFTWEAVSNPNSGAFNATERKGDAEMKAARERASGVLGESEKRAAQIVEEVKVAAKEEADRIIAGAREQIASGVAKAKTELREQVAALAVAGAEKILQREVDAKAHAEMLGKLKAQL